MSSDTVVAEMRRTDSTEDDEFMLDLERQIRKYPAWTLARVNPRKFTHWADDRTVREYAESDASEFPPVIAVPEPEGWYPLDGSHRVAAAILRRDDTIEAWIPVSGSWPPWSNS